MREFIESVPPCRILMEDGERCNKIVTERDIRPRTWLLPKSGKTPAGTACCHYKAAVTLERIIELREKGLTLEEIGRKLGCSKATISVRLSERKKKHA